MHGDVLCWELPWCRDNQRARELTEAAVDFNVREEPGRRRTGEAGQMNEKTGRRQSTEVAVRQPPMHRPCSGPV